MRLLYSIAFIGLYLWEVIRSTGTLAWLVVKPGLNLEPHFVEVPLDLEGEVPRLLMACLVSMTPGSLSVSLDAEAGILHVHLLDVQDEDVSISTIKARIERPLIRIFQPARLKRP